MSWKEDLNYGLAAFGVQIPDGLLLDQLAQKVTAKPALNTAALVAASSILLYAAERNHNPKVNDIWDAYVYCSTCLSVGYGDIFAQTPAGKILGGTLMTVGPALSGQALDGPAESKSDPQQEQILATVRAILDRLPTR